MCVETVKNVKPSVGAWPVWALILSLMQSYVYADQLTDLMTGNAEDTAAPVGQRITTDNTAEDDRKIRGRLRDIFHELDDLRGVRIDVRQGIVTLDGQVPLAESESRALQLARQVEGVVEVENRLVINRDLQARLHSTGQDLQALGKTLVTGLPLFVLALLVLVVFWVAGRWIGDRQSLYRRLSPNPFIATLLGQITHLVFIVLGLVLALVLLDATALIGTVLGAAGIAGLAVGFAVRDTVENYIATILLSVRNPFEVNDLVKIDAHEGHVARLTSRATILISPDGNHVRIPNAMVYKAVIVNFTRNPERRFQFEVGVSTDQDLLKIQALGLETLAGVPGVLNQPRPSIVVDRLGESNVVLRVFAWVDQSQSDFLKVRSEALRETKQAFQDAGVVMPEPSYRLRVITEESGPAVPRSQSGGVEAVQVGPAQAAAARDISVDRTVADKVAEEHTTSDRENLLNPDAPQEL